MRHGESNEQARTAACEPACVALQALYQPLRLYLNFFQPVMVLVEKRRLGAKVKKRYDVPKTPYQRVLEAPEIGPATQQRLRQLYDSLNPAELLRQIQRRQAALWQLAYSPIELPTAAASWGNLGSPRPSLNEQLRSE